MKYFVIGGAGSIGTVLVERILKEKGNMVTVFDNLTSGKLKHLEKFRKENQFSFVKGDILNLRKLKHSMKQHDFIYHLAANPDIRLGSENTRLDFEINTVGTLNVLDAMIANNIKKIAFMSSSAVFGIPNTIPTPENYGPCLPESFYGASKLACEGFISSYSVLYGLKAWIFRIANITGFPTTHGIIFDFYRKVRSNPDELEVLGDGNQKKSYLTNYMVVDGMQMVIKKTINEKSNVLLYNVGNNDAILVKDITKIFLNENSLLPQIKYTGGSGGWKGDVPFMTLDISKIKKLGWEPNKTSKECIRDSVIQNK